MMKIDSGIVKSVSNKELDMTKIPMDDSECFRKLNDLDVFGIFQFETRVAIGVIKEIGIHAFQDMYAATTLGRPDPLSGNLHVTYGRRKRNEEHWESVPVIADIFDQSFGLPIYQESCCIGETKVLTKEGEFSIKDVVENEDIDYVLCINDENDVVERKILQRHRPGKKEVFRLTLDNKKTITCTEDHKILTSNRGYIRAKYLEEDDDIVCNENNTSKLTIIEYMGFQETYDLGIEQYNNYIANGIVVHNSMLLARRLAGFSGGEANQLRKGLAKGKDNDDAMKKLKKLLGELKERSQESIKKGLISQEQLDDYITTLENFGGYGFNKCLSPETVVETENGLKLLSELKTGDTIKAPNTDFSEDEFVNVVDIINSGTKDLFEIELESGLSIRSTMDHKFLCKDLQTKSLSKITSENHEIMCNGSSMKSEKITSIKSVGKMPTIDITVNNHHHLFYANEGIITSNSHAVSYAMVAYWSLFLKTYFPIEFMVSLLNFTDLAKKDDKGTIVLKKYIQYAKKLKVTISPPNINTSNVKFSLDGGVIRWGLGMIKGLGPAAAEEAMNKRPYENLDDFLGKVEKRKLNKSKVVALMKCGAFDDFGDREYLINHYLGEIRKEKGYEFVKFGEEEKKKTEEDLLGMAISFSVMPKDTDYDKLTEYGISKLGNIEFMESGVFIGKIGQIKHKNSQKSGKPMLIVEISDDFDDKSFFVWEKDIELVESSLKTGHVMTIPLKRFDMDSDGCFYCGPFKDIVDLTDD